VKGITMGLTAPEQPGRGRTPSGLPAPERPAPGADPDGHLATGWEPHRPLSDGLLRRFIYAFATSFTGPVSLMGGRVVRRKPYLVWDRGVPAGHYNGALLLQPLPHAGWERIVDGLEADLLAGGAGGAGEVVLFSPWPTPDLTDRGWQLSGHPPLLLRPSGEPEPPTPAWLDVREVADRRTLADWERVAIVGYPFQELAPARRGCLVDERILTDPRLHAWVAYTGGEPIAIGTSYVVHGLHVPTLGVTLAEHRGRGAWQVLMRRRLSTFAALPAMSLFSDLSRPPAEGLGFLPIARWTVWLRSRPGPAAGHRHPADDHNRPEGPVDQPYCPP
jgi:hypothetical protein